MNHDETNPNPEMKSWIEPELEARVIAWVAGEASPFEAAELERLCAEKPELAIFKRRIEAVHGLVGEAVRPEKEPLRMSAERREKLLAVIGGAKPAGEKAVVLPSLATKKNRWAKQWWLVGAAACATMVAYVAVEMPTFGLVREKPVYSAAAVEEQKQRVDALAKREVMAPEEDRRGAREAEMREKEVWAASIATQAQRPASLLEVEKRRLAQEQAKARSAAGASVGTLEFPAVQDRIAITGLNAAPPLPQAPEISFSYNSVRPREADGYSSATTIAGTRLNSSLRNTSSRTVIRANYEADGTKLAGQDDSFVLGVPARQPLADGVLASPPIDPASDRFSTSLGYTGPSVQVATQGFVKDLGAAENSGLLQHSAGTEVGGVRGNFAEVGNKPDRPYGALVLGTGSPASFADNLSPPPPADLTFGSGSVPPASALVGAINAEEVVTLSPFEVSGNESSSYAAATTLAGNRLNTELRDVGSAIQVVSTESLSDFGENLALATVTGGNVINSPARPVAPGAIQVGPAEVQTAAAPSELTDEELDAKKEADDAARAKNAAPVVPSADETSATQQPVSTFSLHVSDVSFQLAKAALERGEAPEAARIRPEEFYNAFDYGDPAPAAAEKIGARIEQAAHPFLQQRNLLRIALKVPATGRGAGQPLRLAVLLDTSGSMEREDRAATVRAAMASLLTLLGPDDRISVIGFARQPRLIADGVAGDATGELLEAIARTPAEGGTNLEEGLNAAIEAAEKHFEPTAQNRIVLMTDGAANLGNADPARLAETIEAARQNGVAFDACGVGLRGLDDDVLEALTRKGNGRYYVLDSAADADAGFARQLAGAFRPAAENVKLQVRFNPARVGRYRLIGFEQHRLHEEDFRNDAVDAAELAAEEGAVALYQVEVLPEGEGEGELGEVFVRFRDPTNGEMVERSWTIAHDASAPAFDRAAPSLQLAGTAALLAEKLRGSELAGQFKLGELAGVANALRGHYAESERVQELVRMFEQMRRRSGE